MLPQFASDGVERAITISDLLHHVAALPDYLNAEDIEFSASSTNAEVVDWLAGMPLTGSPGLRYGSFQLGLSAARQRDRRRRRHTRSAQFPAPARVAARFGIRSTSIATPAPGVKRGQIARGYKGEDGKLEISEEASQVQGDGSVLTTLRDLAHYEQALVEHRLLNAAHTKMLFENRRIRQRQSDR